MRNGFCNLAVLVQSATRSRDEYGHDELTWVTKYSTLWVSVRTRARAAAYADGTAQVDGVTFTTPYHEGHDLERGDRVVWDGVNYEVQTVMDRNGQRAFIDLEAVQVAA
jgi:SPP1 family predicted phage head-tail adaptor